MTTRDYLYEGYHYITSVGGKVLIEAKLSKEQKKILESALDQVKKAVNQIEAIREEHGIDYD